VLTFEKFCQELKIANRKLKESCVRIQKREAALVRAEVLQCSVWGCALCFFWFFFQEEGGRTRQRAEVLQRCVWGNVFFFKKKSKGSLRIQRSRANDNLSPAAKN
jgi:hypothetical protein